MEKRGLSGVVVTVLMILLAIAAIVILWAFINLFLGEQGEVTDAKSELLTENIDIKLPEDAFNKTEQVNLLIERGTKKVVLTSEEEVFEHIGTDVVSVVDLSGSMIDICNVENLQDKTSCENEGKTWLNWIELCNDKDLSEGQALCEEAGHSWISRISVLKEANINFVNDVLGDIPEISSNKNRIGLVAYNSSVREDVNKGLSGTGEKGSLNAIISDWNAGGGTCICCGIRNATNMLVKGSSPNKVMILMSDGLPSAGDGCTFTFNISRLREEVLEKSEEAAGAGIKIYTISFRNTPEGDALMEEIASIGGGVYYSTGASQLPQIYSQVHTSFEKTYDVEKEVDYIKVIFSNETDSCERRIFDVPKPLERKKFEISIKNDDGTLCITNINSIEVYPVVITKSGRTVIGQKLDEVKVE